MPKPTYLHKEAKQSIKDGVSSTYEELIIEGPNGIVIKYFSKDDKGDEKIKIVGKDDKFKMTVKEGDKVEEKELTKDELMNELKKNKKLKFAVDFTKTQKGGDWLERPKKRAKKASSKKASSKRPSASKKPAKKAKKVKTNSKK